MHRIVLFPILVFALAVPGCSSSSGSPLRLLQQCGAGAFLQVVGAMERLGDVLAVIQGEERPNVSAPPSGNENEFNFNIALDLDGDGANETAVSGVISFDADPTDGITEGDMATVVVDQTATEGQPLIMAQLDLTFLMGRRVQILGTAAVNGLLGCDVGLTFNNNDPLNVVLNSFPSSSPQIAVNVTDVGTVSGSAQLQVTNGTDALGAVLVLAADDDTATYTFQALNEEQIANDPAPIVVTNSFFQRAQVCATLHFFGVFVPGFLVGEILDALAEDRTTIEDGTFTMTPVAGAPFTFDITADVTDLGVNLELTMRVTFDGDPNEGRFLGTATITSWTVLFRNVLQGVELPDFSAVGTTAATVTFLFDEDFGDTEVDTFSGSARIASSDGSCTGTAVTRIAPFGAGQFGHVDMATSIDGVPFSFSFVDPSSGDDEDGPPSPIIQALADGVPVPGNLLDALSDVASVLDIDDDE